MPAEKPAYLLQLEGRTAKGAEWSIPVASSPFIIGREEGCHLRINTSGVSRHHAEIYSSEESWWVSDCGSTNGTYVNGHLLRASRPIKPGDVLQFANFQFVVAVLEEAGTLPTQLVNPYAQTFEQMMEQRAVTPYFQPIVRLSDQATLAHEILGRAHFEGLPRDPGRLFEIAKGLDRDIELSQMFRDRGLEQARRSGLQTCLFFNTLPKEMELGQLTASLEDVRQKFPSLHLAMELHESAVTHVAMMKRLKDLLKGLDMDLVYDDFGAGQARLVELIYAAPAVIKFDIALIHEIHTRPLASQAIVFALVRMAQEAGIKTLAEGVENADEAEVCKQMGFDLGQGYFYGKPVELRYDD